MFKYFLSILLLVGTVQAEETISQGLTLKIPTAGQVNWSQLFKEEFAEPVSRHQHTGSGDGLQMVTGSIADNAVTGAKIRLANDQAIRARNAANSADVELLKLNTSDEAEFGGAVTFTGATSFDDIDITGGVITTLDTPLAVANGGTASTTAGDARTALGVAIGSDVQAYSADLATISGLAKTDGNFIVGNGSNWVAESGSTARGSLGLGSLATASTINNANWSGTDLAIGNGGTGASSASAARTNLELGSIATQGADAVTLTGPLTLDHPTLTNDFIWTAESSTTAKFTVNSGAGRTTLFENTGAGSHNLEVGGTVTLNGITVAGSSGVIATESASNGSGLNFRLGSSYGMELEGIGGPTGAALVPIGATFNLGVTDNRITKLWAADITTTNAVVVSSDVRLKKDIQPLESGMDAILNLEPVTYKMIADPNAKPQVGFIAQQALKYVPEAVEVPEDSSEMMGMSYERVVPYLVSAIQELEARVKELEARE